MTRAPALADSRGVTGRDELLFPYMVWAHRSANRTACPLSQSGMPMADARLFESFGGFSIDHPSASALPELERALARRFGVEEERVLVTLGATGGMHLAAQRWFRPGVRVVTDVPSYEPFRALPRLFGAQTIEIRRELAHGWRLDPAEVERRLDAARGPAHVFFANLHNPTGAFTSADELRRIAASAARHGGNALVCEVYMEYVPAKERVFAFDVAENGVSIGSFTKAYGLGALRMGWIVLGKGLRREAELLRDMAYVTYVDPPTMSMQAARIALEHMDELYAPVAQNARAVRPEWKRWLETTRSIESWVGEHGIIAFPRVSGASDTHSLGEHLVAEHGVDIVPGEHFGLPGHIRVGCGVGRETLVDGLARLERGIASFAAGAKRA